MKRSLTFFLLGGLIVIGIACKIVDPIIIALNIPLEVIALLNTGNSWNETKTYNIQDEIAKVGSDYVDKVQATRVADVTIYMPNPPSSGTASGTLSYALDGGTMTQLATFTNVPFDSLKSPGISIAHSSLITYSAPALHILLSALQDSTGLPSLTTISIHTNGTTSVTVPQDTQINGKIFFQADVEL